MFELTLPWILTLLPLPLLLWYILPKAENKLSVALKIPFFNDLTTVAAKEKHCSNNPAKISLFFLIWTLLLLALANPRWVGDPISLSRKGHHIMMALDLSPSMAVEDMPLNGHFVSRLDVVKRAAKEFVQHRVNDKVGLILFGERAYLQTPFTFDTQSILERIDDASAGLAGKSTSLGDALGLAIKHLQHVPEQGRVMILLTDGANNSGALSPLKAAELAYQDKIKIYTIGLGANANSNDFNGMFLSMNAAADLDEGTLKLIAAKTKGRYFRATDLRSLQSIYQAINAMETVTQSAATIQPKQDYYPWPLSLAWILLMYFLVKQCPLRLTWRTKHAA